MLTENSLLKYDPTLKYFLTCENSDEFEKIKNDPKEFSEDSSIAVNSLKNLRLQDTLNYLYFSLKSKFGDGAEPQEIQIELQLEGIKKKIDHYLPFLDKNIAILEAKVEFQKSYLNEQEELAKAFEEIQDDDAELEKTFKSVAEYHTKYGFLLRVMQYIYVCM